MREAIGNTFVINFIIVFVIIFIALFAVSSAYSKGAKVKNIILDIVEENADSLANCKTLSCTPKNGGKYNADTRDVNVQIDEELRELGYRINKTGLQKCPTNVGGTLMNEASNYRYCVYKHSTKNRGYYYTVIAYMYFDIPIINSKLEFPIKGESRMYFREVKYNG